MSPLVSIIIPVYNCERFVAETMESVVRQTFGNFEVLLVDDGSTDGSKHIIKQFASRDDRFRYVYQRNQGVSSARNLGFRQSRGNFIAFLDSDDVWLPDNLDLKLKQLALHNVGWVHSDAVVIDEGSAETNIVLRGVEGNVLDALLLWDGTQVPGPSSVVVKREVLDEVGLFDENLSTAADKDMFIRIAARFNVGRVDKVTWQYRVHPGNMHKNLHAMETDSLYLYSKARKMKLYKSKPFEKKCFAMMYLILAASWAGDGRNFVRAFSFFVRAIMQHPPVIFNVTRKALNRWRRSGN